MNVPLAVRPPQSVIVVGGGLAGISAAMALARHDVRVTLLESRRQLGGRAGSFVRRDSQGHEIETIDYCQHVGMGCCTNLKRLINWLEQDTLWDIQKQLHFFGPTGDYRQLSALPLLPAPLHLTGWLWRWPGLRTLDRMSIARGMLSIKRLHLGELEERQLALPWLVSHGQTPQAIERFWRTIVVSALGEELSRVSLAAMGKVLQDGFLRHREAFHLLVPQRPLGELFGSAAGEQLRKVGVAVELETPVLSIDDSGQQSIRVTTSNREYQAEALVLATAWHQLAKVKIVTPHSDLLERLERAQLLQSSTISGIHTWWDRAWLPTPHAAVVGRLCQWVFPKPMLVGAHNSNMPEHYYQIVVSASQSLELGIRATLESSAATRESWGHTIHDDLAKVFPRVREAKLLRFKVVSDPKAVFSVQPDVLQYRAPAQGSARVMLAGDWTRTGWPATMEGAVLSGFRAAELLLNVPGRCVAQPL